MKSQIKRFSKSTLSVILSICMLVSCMTVGIIATDAAQSAEERVGAKVDDENLGDTTYYMHIGVGSNFKTSTGIAFTYDSTNSLYYASYELAANSEYPMVICTTSGSLGDGQKSSSNQSVITKATTWNPDSIQFDYFNYQSNNYDGYDCFKFKTQTAQTVYFTFTSTSSGLVVRSSLDGSGGDNPTPANVENSLNAIYFTPKTSNPGWTDANARFQAKVTYGDSTTVQAYMTKIPNVNVYVLPLDPSKTASKVKFFRYDPDGESSWNNSSEVDITAGNNYFTQDGTGWSDWTPTQNTYTSMTGYLPDVLGGTKVMFYYGDIFKNNDGDHIKYLNNGTNDVVSATSLKRDTANSGTGYFYYYNSSGTKSSDKKFEASVACVGSSQYYVSNKTKNDWGGAQMAESAAAGKAYVLTDGSTCATGQARGGASFGEATYTIGEGTKTSGIIATLNYSTSVVDETNRVFYVYKASGGSTYYDFNPYDTEDLAAGTYTIYAIVADGGILVNAASATLTIIPPACTSVSLEKTSPASGTIYEGKTAVTYTATATNAVTGVTYNFKVGGTSVQNTSSYTYTTTFASAGTKSVTVTVEKSGYGSVTSSAVDTVVSGVYLLGLKNEHDWDVADKNKMTYNASTGLYEITRNLYQASTTYGGSDQTNATDTGFKVYTNGDSTYYGSANGYTINGMSYNNTTLSSGGHNVCLTTKDLSGVTSSTVPYKFTFDISNKKVTVYYPMKVTYNMQSHGTNPSANGYVVAYGSTITAPTAPTEAGYTFGGWYKESSCTNAWDFSTDTVTEDKTLYAKWTQNSHSITYTTGVNYSYSNNLTTSAHYGDTISFNVTPSSGYRIASVKYNDGLDHTITSSNNTYSFEMPDADVTVSVTTVKTYTVTLTADTGFASRQYKLGSSGTYVDYTSGTTLTVDTGTDVYFKVTYSTGYQYSSNSGLTVVTANTEFRTGSVTANKTTTITASKINYTVTLSKNASDATAGTASVTATYGDAMPTASVTMPTRTGYTFAGYYDTSAATGGTQYYTAAGASARTWNKTSNTTLYARWTEITGGAIAKAYTSGSASSTGGTVKVGASGTAGATANLSAIGIASSNTVIATKGSHYDFAGWQFSGTKCANLRYRFSDSGAWLTPAEGTTYGTASNTTIYIKTDGSTGITTANAEIHALFTPTQYSLTGVTSPAGKGSVEFYSDLSCEQQINPAVANYGNTVYAKYDPGESGYVLKSFSVSGTGASLGTRNGNIIPVTVGSANVIVTANVMPQYSVTYYVDMHDNNVSSLSISITDSNGDVLENASGQNCTASTSADPPTVSKVNSKTTVYSATIDTPLTQVGSGYSALNIRITYNGTNYNKSLASNQVSALVEMSTKEVWLEAVNESSQPLNIQYSTTFSPESGSTPAVATGYRRIYLAKPKGWETSESNWKNIKVYHWGNYDDMGWNNGVSMNHLGYGRMPGAADEDTAQYHFYYVDLPKYVNQDRTLNTDGTGNKVQNIIFQGWADNATSPSVQTGNIEEIPDSADFFILSKDGNSYEGTKSDEDVVIPTYARHASFVKMNVGETTTVNITPVYTGAKIVYSSSDESKVEVNETTGVITPRSSTINGSGTDVPVTITVKVYGSIGAKISDTANGGGDPHNGADAVIYTVSVSVHNTSKFNGFNIMAIESQTYTVSVPQIGSDQPGYFDMTRNGSVITVTGLLGVDSSIDSAIINPITDNPTSFTVKYAKANNTFSGYSDIEIIGTIVTKSNHNTTTGKRYGLKQWKLSDDSDPNYTISRKVANGTGIETATTTGVTFSSASATYSAIFEEYQYVDVTFTFNYDEYKPKKVDADGNVVADDDDGMIQYPYDASWANNEDSSNAQLYGRSHTTKTFVVQNYEVRYSPEKGETFAGNLKNAAAIALGIGPSNNYYDYELPDTVSATTPSNYKATSTVNLIQSVKQYKVYLNGELKPRSNPNDPNDNRTYYYYQEYAEPSVENPADWYAVDSLSTTNTTNAPLLATNVNSYKFRVKGSAKSTNTYLRTTDATNPHGKDFLRSEVDFSHYEVTHQGSTPTSMKEYLMQNFYIADFFSPANVLDPQSYTGKGKFGVAYKVEEVTASTTASSGDITVYFTDSLDWDNICIYYWGENINNINWPGLAMTQYETNQDGKKIYSAEIPGTAEGVIFTGNNNQTVDITNNIANGSHWKSKSETVQNGIPYDDAKFVGGGVVYFSVDEQGNPRSSNAKDLGYVNSDGTLNQDAVKEMLKSEILASVNEGNYGKYTVEEDGQTVQKSVSYESLENAIGTEDALKVAYGTEIEAHQYVENNIKTGVLYRYLPLETFSNDSKKWSNGVPVKDENGNYYTTLNNNTFRYSNTLQSYQYVYASGNENKSTNAGKNMRLYSYYVYSYVAYNQETDVPETKYEIVLSDNYSDASTYWNGK